MPCRLLSIGASRGAGESQCLNIEEPWLWSLNRLYRSRADWLTVLVRASGEAIRSRAEMPAFALSLLLAILSLAGFAMEPQVLAGGSSSVVERQLPKLNVAGSIPVSRSIFPGKACTMFPRVSEHHLPAHGISAVNRFPAF